MDLDEILGSPAFYFLCVIGYGALIFMLMTLKGMDQSIMPLWVKIVTAIMIPIISGLFAGYAEG